MNQDKDFFELAREKYQEFEKQEAALKEDLANIQKQKGPLKNFMKSAGLIEVKRRGRRPRKVAQEA